MKPVKKSDACNNFRANEKKSSSPYLKERGIVGMTCARHGIPLLAVDMTTGEQFIYADFLISQLVRHYGQTRKYYIFYDIACAYSKNFNVRLFL
jgi:hypothetical protein